MKKKFFSTLLTLFFLTILSTNVLAVTIPNPLRGDFIENFNRITSALRPIVILTFLIVFFWGGYLWMTARDSEEQVQKAQSVLISSVVGLIIIFLAPTAVDLLCLLLGVDNCIEFGTNL